VIPKLNIDFPVSRVFRSLVPWIGATSYESQYGNTFFLNHARTGVRLALSALNLPKGSKIGLSMYNCLTVMNAIEVAGYEIVFLDITDDFLLDMNDLKKKRGLLSALIVTHFFGIPNDVDAIKEIVPGIPVIEDCAHAFGSQFNDGAAVGSKGDFAVFSTGLGKFPSIGDGGLLMVNDDNYLLRVKEIVSLLPRNSFVDETSMILRSFAKYIAYRPLIYKLLLPLKRRKQELGSFNDMYLHREAIMPKYVRYLYEKEISGIKEKMSGQQIFSDLLANHLASSKGVIIPKVQNGKRNGYLFPVLVEDKSILTDDCLLSEFELTPHFVKSKIWAQRFGYLGDCPNAERISNSNIVLPCSYVLWKNKRIKKIYENIHLS